MGRIDEELPAFHARILPERKAPDK